MSKPKELAVARPIQQKRLYEIVADHIFQEHVTSLKDGDKLPTEAEFAKIFQVSVPTVREALRSLVQGGHLQRRQGSGTYKTSVLKSSSHQRVAIVTPLDLTDGKVSSYHLQVALQTSKSLKTLGIDSQIYFGETSPADARSFDDSKLVADIRGGVISAAVLICESQEGLENSSYFKALQECGAYHVSVERHQTKEGKPLVADFLEKSVRALMSHGKRKIACIGYGKQALDVDGKHFQKIVSDLGGITDSSWIATDLHPSMSGAGYSLLREVWTKSDAKPDGLILCDDSFFHDVALAIQELRIQVPERLLIATYRNEGERLFIPFPIIEVVYNAKELALQVAEHVAAVLEGKSATPSFDVDVTINDCMVDTVHAVAG